MVQDREEAHYHRIDCTMGDNLWSKTGKKLTIIELTVPWETICGPRQGRSSLSSN